MSVHADKTQHNKSRSVDSDVSQSKGSGESAVQFVDNRPETKQLIQLQELANQPRKAMKMHRVSDNDTVQQSDSLQRKEVNHDTSNSFDAIQLLKDSEVTAKVSVNGISKKNAIYRRKNRPAYADGQVEAVWEASKNGDGKVICPNTGKELSWDKSQSRATQWHMGHKTGHEYNSLWEDLATCVLTWDQFLAAYQDPDNYQAEDPTANMSHAFEA